MIEKDKKEETDLSQRKKGGEKEIDKKESTKEKSKKRDREKKKGSFKG